MSVDKIQKLSEPYMMAGDVLTTMFKKLQELIDRTNEIAEVVAELMERQDKVVSKIAVIELKLERHTKNVNELLAFMPYKPVLNIDEEPNETQAESS